MGDPEKFLLDASHESSSSARVEHPPRRAAWFLFSVILFVHAIYNLHHYLLPSFHQSSSFPSSNLHPSTAPQDRSIDWSFLEPRHQCTPEERKRIDGHEFTNRREGLSELLTNEERAWGVYVTEPGPNTLYYINLTLSDWYLSERPWLLVISPSTTHQSGAHLSILTPSFELSRTQRLPFALTSQEFESVDWVVWEEAQDPYQVLFDHLSKLRPDRLGPKGWKIHLEENVRTFVADGLSRAAAMTMTKGKGEVEVGLADQAVREQRMRKSGKEVGLQRCVAKITLEALRAVRTKLRLGMTEKEGEALITNALTVAGLTDISTIVLFGSNAALPHASASETKRLEKAEFALFDVGGTLNGYISDFTRTMLPDDADRSCRRRWPSERAKTIWTTVHRAQGAALHALKGDRVVAAKVDLAARRVIEEEGFGEHFTHRLGHGIGLQVHEAPYLNAGNKETILLSGEAFSNEPGIYIEGEIGVRLEDMVLKTERGSELISGSPLAGSPWDP